MRIRRTILAPAILAIGATSALAVGPVLAFATAVAPAASATSATPNMNVMHGPVISPNMIIQHGSVTSPDMNVMHGPVAALST